MQVHVKIYNRKKGRQLATRKKLQVTRPSRIELSDGEVELLRQMHEEHPLGHPDHIGIRRLAKIFDIPKNTAAKLCNYERR